MSARVPAGKGESLQLALGLAGIDVCVGMVVPSALWILGLLAFFASFTLLVVQLGFRPRPYEWIAWVCLEASLVSIAVANAAVLASRYAGC